MSPDEHQMRRLFAHLHEDDATPPFERVWRAAARRSGRRPRRFVPAAVFTAMLLIAAGVLWLWRAPSNGAPDQETQAAELAAELAAWSSPLGFLSDVPGSELFGDQPLPAGEAQELLQLLEPARPEPGERL